MRRILVEIFFSAGLGVYAEKSLAQQVFGLIVQILAVQDTEVFSIANVLPTFFVGASPLCPGKWVVPAKNA